MIMMDGIYSGDRGIEGATYEFTEKMNLGKSTLEMINF